MMSQSRCQHSLHTFTREVRLLTTNGAAVASELDESFNGFDEVSELKLAHEDEEDLQLFSSSSDSSIIFQMSYHVKYFQANSFFG